LRFEWKRGEEVVQVEIRTGGNEVKVGRGT
jgi:hypothetical protein